MVAELTIWMGKDKDSWSSHDVMEILNRLRDYTRIHNDYKKLRASLKDQQHAYK